jgi:hypothetical protein
MQIAKNVLANQESTTCNSIQEWQKQKKSLKVA